MLLFTDVTNSLVNIQEKFRFFLLSRFWQADLVSEPMSSFRVQICPKEGADVPVFLAVFCWKKVVPSPHSSFNTVVIIKRVENII